MGKPSSVAWAAAAATFVVSGAARAQGWPDIYDPLVLRTINLQMLPEDWQTIQGDEDFEIWVPTMLWLDGEAPILVAIRRKSADPLNNAPGFSKVSYKIDINEYVSGQNWHGLRAVSLDNGDDENVVSEGLAWYMHRIASGPEGYGYDAGLASWVRLIINGVDTGVYLSAEQRDKRFLQNRGLWIDGETWLYEVEDLQGFEMDEGGPGDSPLVQSLCYSPFASPSSCATPDAATLAATLPQVIDMRGLLSLAAVDEFCANPDAVFSHGKNFYFVDYLAGGRRLHFPWDLDSSLPGGGLQHDVYEPQCAYSQILLGVPEFRALYSDILNDLVCGPFSEANLHAFLDALEPVLTSALEADPNSQIGDVAGYFASKKTWFTQRLQVVTSQIEGFVPCAPVCDPQITSYCTPGTTTNGCNAVMSASGTPSAGASSGFVLTASSVEGERQGLVFYGINGRHAAPWAQGGTSYLCVKSPVQRTNAQFSGGVAGSCTGELSIDWLAFLSTHPAALGQPLSAGVVVDAQAWFRDPSAPATTNLSDGLEFTTCP
jgi:hypothetical protein